MQDDKLITEQEQLFNDIKALQGRVRVLASYFQNSFDKMLEDGIVDTEHLKGTRADMAEKWDTLIDDCRSLRLRSVREISKYIE